MAREKNGEPDAEYATRMGALSMLFNSIVAVMAGALLPYLSRRDTRLLRVQDEDEEEEAARLRGLIYKWRAEAAKKGKKMRLPTLPLLYRTIWIGALVLFTILTMSTFFITSTIGVSVSKPCCRSLKEVDRSGLGHHYCQLGWCLLGCRLLGAVCHHYGGKHFFATVAPHR